MTEGDKTAIFLHIPKTAGTSLAALLAKKLRPSANIIDPATMWAFMGLPEKRRASLRLIYGHMPYGIHRFLDKEPYYITFLRHPVDRVVSAYYFIKSQKEHPRHEQMATMTLAEFAMLPENNNAQTRRLQHYDIVEALEPARVRKWDFWWIRDESEDVAQAHFDEAKACLDRCSFVGVQENFDLDTERLLRALGLSAKDAFPQHRRNNQRPPVAKLERALVELILERNLYDFQLYRYARSLGAVGSVDNLEDWTEVVDGIDLAKAELAYNGAKIELNGGLKITTAEAPWSYAAVLPMHQTGTGAVLATFEVEVKTGVLEIGFLRSDGAAIAGGTMLSQANERQSLRLLARQPALFPRIIVRNGAERGITQATLHEVKLYRL